MDLLIIVMMNKNVVLNMVLFNIFEIWLIGVGDLIGVGLEFYCGLFGLNLGWFMDFGLDWGVFGSEVVGLGQRKRRENNVMEDDFVKGVCIGMVF